MAKYRLKADGYFNGGFTVKSIRVTEWKGNKQVSSDVETNDFYDTPALIPEGSVIELPDDAGVGAHMEPLDDAAKRQCAKYPEHAKPEHHNDLSCLPNTMDMREPEERMAEALSKALAAILGPQKAQEAAKSTLSLGQRK